MDSSDAIQFLILIILICLSAFFSSAETSMTTVNKIRIQTLAQEGDGRAETLLKVIENPGKLLSTILIGNNIVNLSASSLATTLTMRLFGNAAVGISTGIITLLVLIFGEITPKTLASIHQERLALAYAKPIRILMIIMTPGQASPQPLLSVYALPHYNNDGGFPGASPWPCQIPIKKFLSAPAPRLFSDIGDWGK